MFRLADARYQQPLSKTASRDGPFYKRFSVSGGMVGNSNNDSPARNNLSCCSNCPHKSLEASSRIQPRRTSNASTRVFSSCTKASTRVPRQVAICMIIDS